jgi:tRNA(Ile)-lysidine synthase
LHDAEEALDWTADRLWRERASVRHGVVELSPVGLPFDLRRRLLARAILAVDPAAMPRGGGVATAVVRLDRGDAVTLGDVLCRAANAGHDEAVWRFVQAPARRSM